MVKIRRHVITLSATSSDTLARIKERVLLMLAGRQPDGISVTRVHVRRAKNRVAP